MKFQIIFAIFFKILLTAADDELAESSTGRYSIEGKVYPPELFSSSNSINWQQTTKVSINDEYFGFLKEDGSFVISGLPSGSYVCEIINSDYLYEPVRVEINPKGKFRARKVNYIQPAQIIQVPYPLKVKALTRFKYFQTREQWKITDFLFSPMVLMMLLPLVLMLILPKLMSDPEMRKDMESLNLKMPNDMPQMSEMLTSYFSGSKPKDSKEPKSKANPKQSKKRN